MITTDRDEKLTSENEKVFWNISRNSVATAVVKSITPCESVTMSPRHNLHTSLGSGNAIANRNTKTQLKSPIVNKNR